jgi:excinuclease ABC subunit C
MDLKRLPHSPGVYLFKNSRDRIIYVGKAIDLRNRVGSYFQASSKLLPRTTLMVGKIVSYDFVRVESELEALILEANLIKKHRPYFNVRLKDDKDYIYIKITKEDFPTVQLARSKDLKDTKKYFGPFPDAKAARTTYKLLRRLFPFRTCTPGVGKACFYYHIGLCMGPCIGAVDKKTYQQMIRRMISFLQGHKDQVVKDLTYDMNQAAEKLEFEKAGQLKRQIESIDYVTQRTRLIDQYLQNPNLVEDLKEEALRDLAEVLNLSGRSLSRIEAYDNSNIQGTQATSAMVVFTKGEPDKSQYRKFKIKKVRGQDDFAYMKEVLSRRFKHLKFSPHQKFSLSERKFLDVNADDSFQAVPDLIVIDGGKGQLSAAKSVLDQMNLPIPIIGLAKRREEIYLPLVDKPLRLSKESSALKLLMYLRDEAHRFTLGYHRKLRNQALLPTNVTSANLKI